MNVHGKLASGIVLVFLEFLAVSSEAQTQTTGRIVGNIRDEQGAIIVAASVSAESLSNGEKHTGVSDESGNYALASLSPGSFEIRIAAVGFPTELFPNVAVNLGSTTTLDVVLRIAQASVEVTVDESPPLVRTDSAALGGTLDSTTLSVMPLPARNAGARLA